MHIIFLDKFLYIFIFVCGCVHVRDVLCLDVRWFLISDLSINKFMIYSLSCTVYTLIKLLC